MDLLWYFLFPIVVLPFLVRLFQKPLPQTRETQALCVPFFRDIQKNFSSQKINLPRINVGLFFVMSWLCFVLALMRPVAYQEGFFLPSKARQIMLVLDVSGSMMERDFILNNKRMTRLGAVKSLAGEFIKSRQGDAVGLTIFGTEPYIYVPLTQDVQTAQSMLQEIDVGIAGEMTSIGDALGLALKQMKEIPSEEKVIILLSDGVANAGNLLPQEALDVAKQMKVKIYTIGLGTDEQILNLGLFSQRINLSADLDEQLLKNLAQETGGQYFRVKTSEDLQEVYQKLDNLEPIESEANFIRPQTELFWYPLALSMLLFLLGFYIKQRRS